jgi:hypothetical protein
MALMQRYFFHLHNDVELEDEEGSEWGDDDAAILHAIYQARDVAAGDVREGKLNLHDHIDVVTEDGRRVAVITFGQAVKVHL